MHKYIHSLCMYIYICIYICIYIYLQDIYRSYRDLILIKTCFLSLKTHPHARIQTPTHGKYIHTHDIYTYTRVPFTPSYPFAPSLVNRCAIALLSLANVCKSRFQFESSINLADFAIFIRVKNKSARNKIFCTMCMRKSHF